MISTEPTSFRRQKAFADALSKKTRNGLVTHFNNWRIVYRPWEIAGIGSSSLKRAKHLSMDSLQEIANLLKEFGYIKNPYQWLKSLPNQKIS